MAHFLLNGFWWLGPNEATTITYSWGDQDMGARMALPFPHLTGGIFAALEQGQNFEPPPRFMYFVTVQNWHSSAAAFRLRGGNLT